jgi:hypothetical protein
MAAPVQMVVGTEHGRDCTCTRLDAVEFSLTPVVVDPRCPGLYQTEKPKELAGRVAITWPAAQGPAISARGVTLTDADTGKPIVSATKLALILGTETGFDGIVEAEITALVDEDGNITNDANRAYDRQADRLRTCVFRYAVAEMRVAEPGRLSPADGGC